jgi:hypothetical protein
VPFLYICFLKDSTRTDIESLEEALKSAAQKLLTLNLEAVDETEKETDVSG